MLIAAAVGIILSLLVIVYLLENIKHRVTMVLGYSQVIETTCISLLKEMTGVGTMELDEIAETWDRARAAALPEAPLLKRPNLTLLPSGDPNVDPSVANWHKATSDFRAANPLEDYASFGIVPPQQLP